MIAASAAPATYRIFVRDFTGNLSIGVHDHEHQHPQTVRVNLEFTVAHPGPDYPDEIAAVVSYEPVVEGMLALFRGGHIKLLETLAERILDLAMADPRVLAVQVRVEKLDVFPMAEAVGVVMERRRPPPP